MGPRRLKSPRLCGALALLLAVPLSAPAAALEAARGCEFLTRTMARAAGTALFLPSYPTAPSGPLQQVGFLYDNAVTVVALIGCGQLQQARRIGDAMLLALEHDRYWHDGRLRNGYAAGSIDGTPLKLAGWWDGTQGRWLEDDYQAGSDSGNLAWAMLALLALDAEVRPRTARGGDERYLAGAARLARWLETQRDPRPLPGFTGGVFGSESAPRRELWKSTEHNVDLAAAYARLAAASADMHWRQDADTAREFVDSMWNGRRGAFAAGTGDDGVSRNPLLALDAQLWPLLALSGARARYGAGTALAIEQLRAGGGYGYSEASGALWTEGTAQVSLFERLAPEAGLHVAAGALERAHSADGGYFATDAPAAATGFMLDTDPTQPRVYRHLPHLAAAAWVALAESSFNPFTGTHSLPH